MSYDFKARFNEEDFMGFVKNKMFPGSDFYWKRANYNTKDFELNRIKSITLLGRSEDFDLAIYDMTHESENDPKVSLTREAFKFMRQNVEASTLNALIIFKSNNSDNYRLSLLTTDPNNVGRKTEREISNPRRFSFYLGPDAKTKTPEQFLIKKGAISNLEDLKSRFSVEVVNKEFYSNIAGLFYRFIDEAKYPNADRKKFFAVKLIGRIIFCWFLKKKKSNAGKPLMPEELLSLESLGKHQNYFHSVLEPLFFEVLNTPVEKRTSTALLQIEDFAKSIPFLNGGLFEPDDDDKYQGTASYGVIEIADSWFHDLFELLEMYNFTINENTPVDVELSIDPEMLGRIFENLLAEINPETGESARKATGSFYTPREIVEYMVNESLKAYLLQKVEIDEETVDKLLNWSEEAPELSESQSNGILEALDKMKVLDPACGSGAFPMGILQKTALVLEKIDPQSINWILKIVEKIPDSNVRKFVEDQLQKEDWSYVHKLGIIRNSIYGVDIQPIAVEISKLRFFLSLIIDTKINDNEENRGVKPLPNLETKFVCANTLIGLESNEFDVFIEQNPDVAQTKQELFMTRRAYFGTQTKEEKDKIKAKDEELNQKLFRLVSNIYASTTTAAIQKLVAWDPYKHNEIAPFFDPEWMFGVKNGFDIVIGNPPYIKEYTNRSAFDGFRESSPYYMGKMDLWYGFACHGVDWLNTHGVLCFIAQNNWTTSAGAKLMRKKIIGDTKIRQMLDFNTYMIFENADIQTMIMIFERNNMDDDYKFDYRVLLADAVKEDMIALLEKKTTGYTKYFSPKIKRADWKDKLITFNDDDFIFEKIAKDKTCLQSDEIAQGIVFPQDFLDKKGADKLGNKYPVGTGIFGLSQFEKESMFLNEKEKELVQPYFTTEQIHRYYTDPQNTKWLIYTDSSFKMKKKMDEYPNIKEHLDKFKDVFTSDNKPYGLHRSRKQEFFQGKKIISLRKCAGQPCFSYSDFDCYVTQTFFSIKTPRWNLKFLTGILNSILVAFWLKNKGKMQGNNYQIDKEPLMNIPLPQISITLQEPIIDLVDKIIAAKAADHNADTSADEHKIDLLVYHLYGLSFDEAKVIDPELREEEFESVGVC